MAKYTLTVATDDINDVVQCLTPALVAAVKGGHVLTEQPAATEEIAPVALDVAEVKPAAKRGRKPKAVEAECQPEPVVEQPVAEEKAEDDFADALGDDPLAAEAVVTKQQVNDAAVEVGSKHGRNVMIDAIKKFTPLGKLIGVAESDYPKLHALLTKMAAAEKGSAAAILETV